MLRIDIGQLGRNLYLIEAAATGLFKVVDIKKHDDFLILSSVYILTDAQTSGKSHMRHNEPFQHNFLSVQCIKLVRCT